MDKEYTWKPYDSFVYQDGFINPTKFKAKAYDNVNSLNAINPLQFKEMISEKEDKMIFEKIPIIRLVSKLILLTGILNLNICQIRITGLCGVIRTNPGIIIQNINV